MWHSNSKRQAIESSGSTAGCRVKTGIRDPSGDSASTRFEQLLHGNSNLSTGSLKQFLRDLIDE